jgi:hypothetical protein
MSLTSKCNKESLVQSQAPMELRNLARLELKKRQLMEELAGVATRHRQLSREIELRGIPIPWFGKV